MWCCRGNGAHPARPATRLRIRQCAPGVRLHPRVQLRQHALLSGRVGGQAVDGEGQGVGGGLVACRRGGGAFLEGRGGVVVMAAAVLLPPSPAPLQLQT